MQNGVNSLTLYTEVNTASDAIVIFQNAVDTITSGIKVFLNQDDNKLVEGNNSINVTITYNDIKENITAKLLNVQPKNQQILDEAIQLLQNGVNSLTLYTEVNTASDAIVIFQNAVDTITSGIKVFLNQDDNKLVEGNNSINVTITYNGVTADITAKLLNVQPNDNFF